MEYTQIGRKLPCDFVWDNERQVWECGSCGKITTLDVRANFAEGGCAPFARYFGGDADLAGPRPRRPEIPPGEAWRIEEQAAGVAVVGDVPMEALGKFLSRLIEEGRPCLRVFCDGAALQSLRRQADGLRWPLVPVMERAYGARLLPL